MDPGISTKFSILKQEFVDAAVNTTYKGELFSDRIWSNKAGMIDKLQNSIISAMKGETTIDKIGKQITNTFNATAYESQRLVNTELARVETQAGIDVGKDAGAEQVMWSATLEGNTCGECGGLDGKTFPINEPPDCPLHPECRCCLINVPYTGWTPSQRLDRETGELVDYKDYNSWFSGLPGGISPVVEPVVPELPAFVPATSIKEAEKYALDENLADKINYKGLDVEVANQWNQSLFETLQKYPELRKNMEFIGTIQASNAELFTQLLPKQILSIRNLYPNWSEQRITETAKIIVKKYIGRVPADVYARSCSILGVKGICVNKNIAGNVANFISDIKKDVAAGFHPIGSDTIKSIVDHELAHQIDALLLIRDEPNIQALFADSAAIENGLSRYALKNIKETIAEGYSEYMNNPSPRPIAKEIGETIERKYTKWKKSI